MAHSPNFNIFVCKDDSQRTCEQDFEQLCPSNYELCSAELYNNNSHGWIGKAPTPLLGKIFCRSTGVAGQLTLRDTKPYSSQISPDALNFGSSLPECPTAAGCNDRQFAALCCHSLT